MDVFLPKYIICYYCYIRRPLYPALSYLSSVYIYINCSVMITFETLKGKLCFIYIYIAKLTRTGHEKRFGDSAENRNPLPAPNIFVVRNVWVFQS